MSKVEYYEYDPQDPRNLFSLSKFIKENNIPLGILSSNIGKRLAY